jgi:hypothetical protein
MSPEAAAFLWRCSARTLFWGAFALGAVVWLYFCLLTPVALVLAVCSVGRVVIGPLAHWYHGEWLAPFWIWRLTRRAADFRAVAIEGITVLFFPPRVGLLLESEGIIRRAKWHLDELSQQFGVRLPHGLTVVVYPTHGDLSADFGRSLTGTLLPEASAVFLSVQGNLTWDLRYYLIRLLASRCNADPPWLLDCGLMTWMHATTDLLPIEERAARLVRQPGSGLAPLLEDSGFDPRANEFHGTILAGGFTGFLIRKFGWHRYLDCYRKANPSNFRQLFEKQFGMSLEWAWQMWRESPPTNDLSTLEGERCSGAGKPCVEASGHTELPTVSDGIAGSESAANWRPSKPPPIDDLN